MTGTEALAWLNRPRSAAGLAAFRILFGTLMTLAVLRFAHRGWIDELLLSPAYHFTYYGFGWVEPLPAPAMYALFALMGVSALAVALGFLTRAAAATFCATFTYAELIDKATYLNHYYLVSLLALLLVFVPSNAVASLDARLWPRLRSASVGNHAYLLLRAQVAVVYFFAGVAKLDSDWLFSAEPLRTWLFALADTPLVGGLLAERWLAYAMSWAGAAFDLTIVPLLSHPRTRTPAYVAAAGFHLLIWLLFPVGMFSFIMLTAGTLFFDPRWPERLLRRAPRISEPAPNVPRLAPAGLAIAASYLLVQLVVPLRHLAYPGNPNWTEEAFRFAWRVMLIEKSGSVEYRVVSARGVEVVHPREELTALQAKMLSTQPDMIHEYALHLAERYRRATGRQVQVYADAWAALNGRPSQRLIDPEVDLARVPRTLSPQAFIVPLAGERDALSSR